MTDPLEPRPGNYPADYWQARAEKAEKELSLALPAIKYRLEVGQELERVKAECATLRAALRLAGCEAPHDGCNNGNGPRACVRCSALAETAPAPEHQRCASEYADPATGRLAYPCSCGRGHANDCALTTLKTECDCGATNQPPTEAQAGSSARFGEGPIAQGMRVQLARSARELRDLAVAEQVRDACLTVAETGVCVDPACGHRVCAVRNEVDFGLRGIDLAAVIAGMK